MKTTESGQMNQNTELVKRLRESGETLQAGMVLCRQAALTISTQERVIVELRKALKFYGGQENYDENGVLGVSELVEIEVGKGDLQIVRRIVIDRGKTARAALSKGSGQ